MKKYLALVVGCLLALSCAEKPGPVASTDTVARQARESTVFDLLYLHVASRMKLSYDCSAGAALVLKNGSLVYEEYLGATRKGEGAQKIDANSRFPFFSISKGFASGLLLSLVSDGLLDLDDPVSRYLDYFTGLGPQGKFQRENVKIRHLASHTSGVALPEGSNDYDTRDNPPFSSVTLAFEPGTDFNYNEKAMMLLGLVLEKAGGKPYGRLLQERILDPLGLKSVGFVYSDQPQDNLVYTFQGFDSASISYVRKPYPGSGLYGNMRDLARYAQLWLDRGRVGDKVIFKPELIQQAWSTQPPGRVPDPDYGLLFWLFPECGAKVFSGAAHTIVAILPEKNMVVVMGLNQRKGFSGWDFEAEKKNLARVGLALDEFSK